MSQRRKSREMIIQTFYALLYTEVDEYLQHLDYINQYKALMDDLFQENELEKSGPIYEFVEQNLKNMFVKLDDIDAIIKKYCPDYSIDLIGNIELIILRLSIYEMVYSDTPGEVMIDEAVELAKKFCAEKAPSMINAILDKVKSNEVNNV
jgi:N utilization substance protein B